MAFRIGRFVLNSVDNFAAMGKSALSYARHKDESDLASAILVEVQDMIEENWPGGLDRLGADRVQDICDGVVKIINGVEPLLDD